MARKAGWDTHGLAVEIEVEKRLGFSGKQQIEAYGIAEFNQACLDSVHTYERQWRAMTERVGYWLDLDHAYFTYTNEYIESVWWALSELAGARPAERGLQDPALLRPLRHHPVEPRGGAELQGRGRSVDLDPLPRPARAAIRDDDRGRDAGDRRTNLYLVAWTTTPWTTIANVGLAVHPDLIYKVVEHPGKPGDLHPASATTSARRCRVAIEEDGKRKQIDLRDAPALARFRGRDLEGLLYDRLFTFFEPERPRPACVLGDYVTATDGTGLVHTAPPFGEDDYQTGRRYGLPMILLGRRRGEDGRRGPARSPGSGSRTPTPRSSRTSRAAA